MLAKSQLRQYFRKRRQALSKSQQRIAAHRFSHRLLHFLVQHQITRQKRRLNIGVYHSNDGEINSNIATQKLTRLGFKLFLPIVQAHNKPLVFRVMPASRLLLRSGSFGIGIPQNRRTLTINHIDCLLLPLVAYDRHNNRLGMGGGFYDRTLNNKGNYQSLLTIGAAHACQFSRQPLPQQATDQPVDWICSTRFIVN